jgi:hypothetical protein
MEISKDEIARLRAIAAGDYVAPPKDAFDLHADALFGGITGFPLPMQVFEVMPGLTLTRTYAQRSSSRSRRQPSRPRRIPGLGPRLTQKA